MVNMSDSDQRADGYWQWAVQYGDGEPSICEGTEGFETAEEEARECVAGNAMIRANNPDHPASRVVKRWVQTGSWTPAP